MLSERSFVPDASYATQEFRVLRRADGTAFYLFLPNAAARLRFTYRRDNTAPDPRAPVYSQGGSTEDEIVVLDLQQ